MDFHEGSSICTGCGCVTDRIGFWYDVPTSAMDDPEEDHGEYINAGSEIARMASRQSEYKRLYHYNERWAQLLLTGPTCPECVVLAASSEFRRGTVDNNSPEWINNYAKCFRRFNAHQKKINSVNIRKICRNLGMPNLAERWIDCRLRVMDNLGYNPHIRFPSSVEVRVMCHLFYELSRKFDHMYYRGGKRRTKKDNSLRSERYLARHNFPNYNYTQHQLHWMLGIRRQCNCHFYWPLLKTYKVLLRLQVMWEELTLAMHWPCASLVDILDKNYTYDAVSLARVLQETDDEGRKMPNGLPLDSDKTSI